jgi:hypothetical protein
MKKLNIEKLECLEGGCTCSGAGVCCERWNLGGVTGFGDWAVCFSCDGAFLYAEPW